MQAERKMKYSVMFSVRLVPSDAIVPLRALLVPSACGLQGRLVCAKENGPLRRGQVADEASDRGQAQDNRSGGQADGINVAVHSYRAGPSEKGLAR
jgi:hypothetical protein